MKNLIFPLILLLQLPAFAQSWADSIMNTLTPDQRVAQLIHVAVTPGNASETNTARELIKEYGIGGILLMRSQPSKGARLINELQGKSQVPLLVSVDGEWGLDMRLDSTIAFPYAMGLGAIHDISLLREMGKEVARQCLRMGIHMNFAPVMDVNNNPRNPVIGFRSFGENPQEVRKRGMEYAIGMAEGGILCTMKHFPGHGDTGTDSHVGLPVIKHKRDRLNAVELFPFSQTTSAYANSIGVMVGHLNVPALDPTPNLPASLSKPIITDLLKGEMGFEGLVVTDALNMKGVLTQYKPGDVEVKALEAGQDLLLFPVDVPRAIQKIRAAINRGQLSQAQIDRSCRKLLEAKSRVGLEQYQPIELAGLIEELNTSEAKKLNHDITTATLTLLRNRENILPLLELEDKKIITVAIGRDKKTLFQKQVGEYTEAFHHTLPKQANFSAIQAVRSSVKRSDIVLMCIHQEGKRPGLRTRLSAALRDFVNEMAQSKKAVIVYFRNPYTLKHFQNMPQATNLLLAYQDGEAQQKSAANLIFGKESLITGKLPVTASADFPFGDGVDMPIATIVPEPVITPDPLPDLKPKVTAKQLLKHAIDSIANAGLEAGAYPGCQVFVAHKGQPIFHETYGYHTFDKNRPVQKNDIYDLASVTKCSAPLAALMKLHGQGKFNLDVPFHTYWEDWEKGNKSTLAVREILAHQARLVPYIPFYTLEKKKDGTLKRRAFRTEASKKFDTQIADNLYQRTNYRKRMYKLIRKTELKEESKYLYSGLSFLLYPEIITQLTGVPYEDYLRDSVYTPIGATTLCFNAGNHFPLERIVPTERDSFFRQTLLHGTVHDEAAIMFGGVSGNAGLFGNAEDLAKLWQMYMNMGESDGVRLIPETTLKEFTTVQYPQNDNRRGLGFDKPMLENPEKGYVAPSASQSSFGHSGYTGTMVWADPENELLFIFLSNRVHPTRKNRKLYEMNIRPSMHEAFYRYLSF